MKTQQHLQIGLFGFGVVGEGVYRIIKQTPELKVTIKRICIKQEGKQRMAPDSLFTTDQTELLNDTDINLIVEVIDDANAAFKIVSAALRNGKDVISANKKMIAENLSALLELTEKTGRSLLYEAAVCASIPVIRNLEEYYTNDTLYAIRGIINGSTNFILTKMFEEGLSFKYVLLQAQQLGFAEANPRLDVEGYDALYKWILLLTHAYGIILKPEHMLFNGIQNIHKSDANVAKSKGFTIRLVAQAKKLRDGNVAAFVFPQFVKQDCKYPF
jgi:homoserine dehydrogenase